MTKWFKEVELETDNIKLTPINTEHKDDLIAISGGDDLSELWDVSDSEDIESYIANAVENFVQDKGLVFVVIDKKSNKIIGTTRYTNAVPEHKRVEIGYTWYTQNGQKIYSNSECKLLLLTHAFEELKAIAVGFRANRYNFQLRNAILRLGAKQDGILRNHQILPGGLLRDTVIFSIIDSEWEACKHSLLQKIEQIHKKSGC